MILFENDSDNPAFWFAAEEYIMRTLKPNEPVLMVWSTRDTVMLGANQIARAECDLEYTKSSGIEIVRRPSGGGAIFTDKGALQLTVILPYIAPECSGSDGTADTYTALGSSGASEADTEEPSSCVLPSGTTDTEEPRICFARAETGISKPSCVRPRAEGFLDHKAVVRDWLAGPISQTLTRFGAKASLEGRNDIIIDGKKISGMAQHVQGGYICSHCSLLFDADLEQLERVLSVDREKIETKAIASVRARVTNISEHIAGKDLEEFRDALIDEVCCPQSSKSTGGIRRDALSRRIFDTADISKIEKIVRDRYANPGWNFGREPAFTFTNKKRFPGGQIEVFLNVKGGAILSASINGDFLSLRPTIELEEALKGLPHRRESLTDALRQIDVAAILGSLGADELLEVLT